jgi:hypothetical protein
MKHFQHIFGPRKNFAQSIRCLMVAAVVTLGVSSSPIFAQSQSACVKDDLGRPVCAKAGGMAVKTLRGVACAPGRCALNNLGYWRCSKEPAGGAVKDDLGRVKCVGGCIDPIKDYCEGELKE